MKEEAFQIQAYRCTDCNALHEKSPGVCPACLGTRFESQPVSGDGTLASWTTIRKPPLAMREQGVYDVAVIDLDAGLRVTGRMQSHDGQQVGDRVALAHQIDIHGEQINVFEVQH